MITKLVTLAICAAVLTALLMDSSKAAASADDMIRNKTRPFIARATAYLDAGRRPGHNIDATITTAARQTRSNNMTKLPPDLVNAGRDRKPGDLIFTSIIVAAAWLTWLVGVAIFIANK